MSRDPKTREKISIEEDILHEPLTTDQCHRLKFRLLSYGREPIGWTALEPVAPAATPLYL